MGLGAKKWRWARKLVVTHFWCSEKSRWAPGIRAGREFSLICQNGLFKHGSRDFLGTSPPTLHSSPREIGRGPWRLFGVLGSSPTPPWVFKLHQWWFCPFWVEEEDGSQIGDGDAKGRRKWSMEQLPRTLGKALHLLFGSNFFPISSICRTLSSPPWRAFPICWD